MLELIAQGTEIDYRWRRQIPPETEIVLGRTTASFRVPWDNRVSRNHASLKLVDGRLTVQKLPEAANPIFFDGSEEQTFWMDPGDHFVIGNTSFTLSQEQAFATQDVPNPISQKTFSPEFLRHVHYRNAEQRIDVLNRLPEIISSAGNEQDLMNRLVSVLLAGISSASTIAIVRQGFNDLDDGTLGTSASVNVELAEQNRIEVIHWDRRGAGSGDFQPSGKLIRESIDSTETILHVWQAAGKLKPEFTFDYENNWAFVCPIDSPATPRWGIYVTGSNKAHPTGTGSEAQDLQGDVKFCELVGSTLKNLLLVKQLERRQAGLRSFFAPIVLDAIGRQNPDEVLAPKECLVSVLFCDLRGFAQKSEAMADDLFLLLERVSSSLDITTSQILNHGGVIGDFHGDSAMGFWGWPFTQEDTARRAVEAALEIKAELDSRSAEQPDFQMGIGIATGVAVAGKIGTSDQVKVTVFGPVVNLASRLEGMTRWLDAAILIDRATLEQIRSVQSEVQIVTRRLGRFQPFGMTVVIEIWQLLDQNDNVDASSIEEFESAQLMFEHGDWAGASAALQELPATDSVPQALEAYMLENRRETDSAKLLQPPVDWDGVIVMKSK